MSPVKNTVALFQVDAFAEKPFEGNPAGVCLLRDESAEDWMQAVAAEMNLPATAFVRQFDDGYELRWFAPGGEIMLCGHGTLASAHVMWTEGIVPTVDPIRFQTKGGTLICRSAGEIIELNFPATIPAQVDLESRLVEALQVHPTFVGKSKFDYFVVVESEQ